jgi:hypothetical protein
MLLIARSLARSFHLYLLLFISYLFIYHPFLLPSFTRSHCRRRRRRQFNFIPRARTLSLSFSRDGHY